MRNFRAGRPGMRRKSPGVKAVTAGRAIYNDVAQKFPGKITTPSYLRLEKEVTGAVSSVEFDTIVNVGTPLSTERRLNISDLFVVTALGLFISKIASPSTPALHATKILRTFPNPLTFSGSGEAVNLMAIYNGYMSLRINSDVIIDSLPASEFYEAGNYQQGVGSDAANNYPVTRDQLDGNKSGYVPINPSINLDGSKKIQWSLQLPASTNLAGTSSVNTVSLILKGFLVQQGGNISTR